MVKEVLPLMMSRRMVFNLTDKSSEVSQKAQQVLKKHFGSIDGDVRFAKPKAARWMVRINWPPKAL